VRENIEQLEDNSWKATCPYDGKEFVADTRSEALTKEGVHRAENHVQPDDRYSGESESDGITIVDTWKRNNDRKVRSA
jgi:hypothetical protein